MGTCASGYASAAVTCPFDTSEPMVAPVNYWVSYEDFELVSSFSVVFMTPPTDFVCAIEGSHFGGHVFTITGANMGKGVAVSHVVDGVYLFGAGCNENLADVNTLTYVTNASGSDSGAAIAIVSITANGLLSMTAIK